MRSIVGRADPGEILISMSVNVTSAVAFLSAKQGDGKEVGTKGLVRELGSSRKYKMDLSRNDARLHAYRQLLTYNSTADGEVVQYLWKHQ